jgi:hypothetical protein
MPFMCSICDEESTRICARCTKDACDNHLCEKCHRCSDCCECEVVLSESRRATVRPIAADPETGTEVPYPSPADELEIEDEPEIEDERDAWHGAIDEAPPGPWPEKEPPEKEPPENGPGESGQ